MTKQQDKITHNYAITIYGHAFITYHHAKMAHGHVLMAYRNAKTGTDQQRII